MREIKFRGVCEISGDMVFGDLIHGVEFKKGNVYILPNVKNLASVKHCDPLDGVRVNPETVGEFSGQKDKNESDIYENDILLFGNENKAVVTFENGCFSVFKEPLGWDFDSEEKPILFYFGFCEIIGNIHKNPELITPTNNTI